MHKEPGKHRPTNLSHLRGVLGDSPFASHLMKDREKEVPGSPPVCTQVKRQAATQIPPFLLQTCTETGVQWLLEESKMKKIQNLSPGGQFYTNLKP